MTSLETIFRKVRGEKGLEKYVTKRRAFAEGFFAALNPIYLILRAWKMKVPKPSSPEEISRRALERTGKDLREAMQKLDDDSTCQK